MSVFGTVPIIVGFTMLCRLIISPLTASEEEVVEAELEVVEEEDDDEEELEEIEDDEVDESADDGIARLNLLAFIACSL